MVFDDLTDEEVEVFRRDLADRMAEAVQEVASIDDPADVERCGFELGCSLALAPPRIVAEALGMIAAEEQGARLLGRWPRPRRRPSRRSRPRRSERRSAPTFDPTART